MDITGTTNDEVLYGTSGADRIDGLAGNDRLYGGAGDDTITGGPGTDYLFGEDGNDHLVTKRGTGPDHFDGGAGTDKVTIDLAKMTMSLSVDLTDPSVKQYFGDSGSIVNVEQIDITGGTAADRFVGGALADTLNGYDADDILMGRGGNDTIIGGNGYDVAVFAGAASDYTLTAQSDGSYKISSALEGTDTLTGIETLRFADGDQPIAGYTSSAVYWGSANGTSTLLGGVNVPDGLGATPGTGFTITGLTRADDGTWWAANEGQANPTDNSYTPSLVHLSADGQTKLGEISIGSKTTRSLQGLVYHSGELFVASLSEGLVKVYDASSGAFKRSITPTSGTSVNGVAFDTSLNAVIIGHEDGNALIRQVEWRNATNGSLIKTLTLANAPDHLFFEAGEGAQGTLWYTYGDSGAGRTGYVAKVDVATGAQLGLWTVPSADAVEGIVVDGTQMWLANDAYFHAGNPALNRVLSYSITPEALVVDRSNATSGFTLDLGQNDQTLIDGTHLVGVERLFFSGGSGNDSIRGGQWDDVLVGGTGSDLLKGAGGNDRLVGASGNDVLQGDAGNDGLEGADGTDTAVFSGTRASYSITKLSDTSLSIADIRAGTPDGTDTATSVEYFKFADGTFSFADLFQVNAAPTGLSVTATTNGLSENVTVGTGIKVADIAIADDGAGSNVLSLVGPDATSFSIVTGATGQSALYYVGSSPDFESKSSYSVTVVVQDPTVSGSSALQQSFGLAVTNVNEAPTAVQLTNSVGTVSENASVAGGIRVADIAIVDDALGMNGLTLSGADASAFSVRATAASGAALFYVGPALDFEAKASYAVTVSASDAGLAGSAPVTADYRLQIGDINEAPTALALLNPLSSIQENSVVGSGIKVADIAVTDDALGTNSVTLSGADASAFAVRSVAGAGTALFYVGQPADFEAKPSYAVTVNVSDAGLAGSSVLSTDYRLQVADLNEAPSALALLHTLASIQENSPVDGGVKVADIGINDDALGTNSITLSGADAGLFAVRTVTGGPALFYVGSSPDFETKSSYAVTVNVHDDALPASSTLHQDYTLAVADVVETSGPTEGNDVVYGTALADTLSGLGGDDQLFGYGGSDTLIGGTGNDVLEGGLGADALQGGDGLDAASYANAAAAVRAELMSTTKNSGEAVGDTHVGVENLIGSKFDDSLGGDNGANQIFGGDGNDVISGQGGADLLYGGNGNDNLSGNGGNDRVEGGLGDDVLAGGASGKDWFAYTSSTWGRDKITDFEDNLDLLDFRGSGLKFSDLQFSQQTGGVYIETADHSSSILIQNLKLAQLTSSDFLF